VEIAPPPGGAQSDFLWGSIEPATMADEFPPKRFEPAHVAR
jgi:hypothetical protein